MVLFNFFTSTHFSHIICLLSITSVFGCGQFPQGEVTAMTFTATGFTLPVEMAYSEKPDVHTAFPSIARSKDAAIMVLRNLIMNTINDVLQEQGRSALLPDAVISLILQQLNVTIEYTPLNCPAATKDPMNVNPMVMPEGCFIIGDIVNGVCTMAGCNLMNNIAMVKPTPVENKTMRGSLRTSNVIIANWSRQMWQSVLNRVSQKISSGQFRKSFSGAVVTVTN